MKAIGRQVWINFTKTQMRVNISLIHAEASLSSGIIIIGKKADRMHIEKVQAIFCIDIFFCL
jgi:hypothetical protein